MNLLFRYIRQFFRHLRTFILSFIHAAFIFTSHLESQRALNFLSLKISRNLKACHYPHLQICQGHLQEHIPFIYAFPSFQLDTCNHSPDSIFIEHLLWSRQCSSCQKKENYASVQCIICIGDVSRAESGMHVALEKITRIHRG